MKALWVLIFWLGLGALPCGQAAVVRHDLQVELLPEDNRFSVQDAVTLPPERPDTLEFSLQAGLAPRLLEPQALLEELPAQGREARYRVRLPPKQHRLRVSYGGRLFHVLDDPQGEHGRALRRTAGQIGREGVYLTGGSLWYPRFGEELLTFSLRVRMPQGWRAISQGRPAEETGAAVTWIEDRPQEQIFLIAAPFTVYKGPAGPKQAMVYLRGPEPGLAERYLPATDRYLDLYERLIGPYPYDKFALVENYWESGLGMPSFTLLGPKVIRFPFILHSSYPHEILHNWWGNSVYPSYETGNWAEGLTAYLADHLLQEQRGESIPYRQTLLQKYTDYVAGAKDFPLSRFTSRHNAATEAVGYGKAMMLFHMLRRQLGEPAFMAALQAFYSRFRFKRAGWDDLQEVFAETSGQSLDAFFAQWVRRSGAPRLTIESARVRSAGGRYEFSALIKQQQPEAPFFVNVPLALTLEGAAEAHFEIIPSRERAREIVVATARRPLRLDVDPRYDLFRKLDRAEIPPAFSQLFGAERLVAVLPSAAPEQSLKAWQSFAGSLRQAGPRQVTEVFDRDLERLPADRGVVVLGWENRFRAAAAAQAAAYGAKIDLEQTLLDEIAHPRAGRSVALALRHPSDPEQVLAWVAADPPEALAGLARKLPHYHKYSFLVFAGSEPEMIASGRWPVPDSPLTLFLGTGRPSPGRLPKETPLADIELSFLKDQ